MTVNKTTGRPKTKFAMVWNDDIDRLMRTLAKKRHIGLPLFLRAVVIPEWLADQKAKIAQTVKKV